MPINDNADLPSVIYDFAPGYMHQRLTQDVVAALQNRGLTQKLRTFEHEMRPYFEKKIRDPQPAHLLPIFLQYVNIIPEDWHVMESSLGKKLAREYVPRADEVPAIVWEAQDWLDHLAPERGDFLRDQLAGSLETGVWNRTRLLEIVAKHLKRAHTNTVEAHAFAHPRPEVKFSDRRTA